jgi:hypothetical protein
MYLPNGTIPGVKPFAATSGVYLEAQHICIKREIADKVFGLETVALSIYYAKDNTFMVAPASEDLFKSIHKATQQMLKSKNLAGDKSISIQELILDNDIDENNRDLAFIIEEALHILKITL